MAGGRVDARGRQHSKLHNLPAWGHAVQLLRVRRHRPRRGPGAHPRRSGDPALVAVDRSLSGKTSRHAGGRAVGAADGSLAPEPMRVVDAHVHLWDPGRLRYTWLDGTELD